MQTIGFIGLGDMGQGMATKILKAGYAMVVYDLREETKKDLFDKGAQWATSAADVAKRCDVIFTSLPGPKEVDKVAIGPQGLLNGIRLGSIYVDLTSNQASLVRKIASMFSEKGAHVLAALVSGGVPGAISGNLAIAQKMRVGLAKPACRSMLQTALSCIGKEPLW